MQDDIKQDYMRDDIRNEVFKIEDSDSGYLGYILDKSTETQLIQNCLFTFVQWAMRNKKYDFDHVEVIIKYDTVGIKWHVRTQKPNPST